MIFDRLSAARTIRRRVLSKEQGFDVALPSSQVLYGKETLDISDEVLARLNKQLPKVAIEVKE